MGSFTALQLSAGSSIAAAPVEVVSQNLQMPTIDQVSYGQTLTSCLK
jgi:hypothetical protein